MNAELVESWTTPLPRECLRCYLARVLHDHGCDHSLRWTTRWRASCAPSVAAVLRHARCDCALLAAGGASRGGTPAPCAGVTRLGSTRPCRRWPP
ncbi:DUF2695 domain-containing protein [Amycolatopsis bartoniae]|nr:DUF2695 domain-containing protein [Amycolatopsis bartoniae]